MKAKINPLDDFVVAEDAQAQEKPKKPPLGIEIRSLLRELKIRKAEIHNNYDTLSKRNAADSEAKLARLDALVTHAKGFKNPTAHITSSGQYEDTVQYFADIETALVTKRDEQLRELDDRFTAASIEIAKIYAPPPQIVEKKLEPILQGRIIQLWPDNTKSGYRGIVEHIAGVREYEFIYLPAFDPGSTPAERQELVFRSCEFSWYLDGGKIVAKILRLHDHIDDAIGQSGESLKPLPELKDSMSKPLSQFSPVQRPSVGLSIQERFARHEAK